MQMTERMREKTRKNVINFFLESRKAFDTIDHALPLREVKLYWLWNNCHNWFRSYVHGRQQHVQFSKETADWLVIICGVPQGSILWPLFFHFSSYI